MSRFRLSELAKQDITGILSWTHERFGETGRIKYEALILHAIFDLASGHDRVGVVSRPDLYDGAATYHLHFSRNSVPSMMGRIRKARHFILFRFDREGVVEVARILHESMDLARHLPPPD